MKPSPMAGASSFPYTRLQCAQSPRAPVASLTGDTHVQGDQMPRYRVTGGPGGDAGIDLSGKRYEPGDNVEAPAKAVKWLVDDGYLTPAGKTAAEPAVEEE